MQRARCHLVYINIEVTLPSDTADRNQILMMTTLPEFTCVQN